MTGREVSILLLAYVHPESPHQKLIQKTSTFPMFQKTAWCQSNDSQRSSPSLVQTETTVSYAPQTCDCEQSEHFEVLFDVILKYYWGTYYIIDGKRSFNVTLEVYILSIWFKNNFESLKTFIADLTDCKIDHQTSVKKTVICPFAKHNW